MIDRTKKPLVQVLGFAAALAIGLFATNRAVGNPRHQSTVRIRSGDQHGSGVIVKQINAGYWVITNSHVLSNVEVHCLESSGKSFYPSVKVPLENNNDDLALLWFKAAAQEERVASVANTEETIDAIELVIATGYPARGEYVERPGLKVPLLSQPLEGGYELTYTSDIDKGMSGGGLFDVNDHLVGINATHQEPLWQTMRQYKSGQQVSEIMNQKLDQVAVGLDIQHVLEIIANADQQIKIQNIVKTTETNCSAGSEE